MYISYDLVFTYIVSVVIGGLYRRGFSLGSLWGVFGCKDKATRKNINSEKS